MNAKFLFKVFVLRHALVVVGAGVCVCLLDEMRSNGAF
jgi:hypothetical protein